MFRINQSSSGAAKHYFTSAAEYYGLGEQEIVGDWGGEAADRLDLHGAVQPSHFASVCDNRHPFTAERLTARMRADRRVGYDFNFHVCKSLSLLYAVTADPAILAAFRWAMDKVMRKMESGIKCRVRKGGQMAERLVGNMAWAENIHFTSRPVNGVVDPQLHGHCFVPNLCWDHVEHAWKAIDVASVKENAPYWQELFHKLLAERLGQLGFAVAWQGKSFEIAGIERDTIERFSQRTMLINRVAEQQGITDAREKDRLGALTRERKRKDATMPQLREQWTRRLTSHDQAALAAAAARRRFTPTRPDGSPLPYGSLSRQQYEAAASRGAVRRVDASALPPGLVERQQDGRFKRQYDREYAEPQRLAVSSSMPSPAGARRGR